MPSRKKSDEKPTPPIVNNISYEWVLLDLGNANARMWCSGLREPISWRSVQGHTGHKTRFAKLPADWSIRWHDNFYVFGERANAECQDSIDDWTETDRYTNDWYKRMFAFSLYRASFYRDDPYKPYEPVVVLSVPAQEYSNVGRLQTIEDRLTDLYKIETVKNEVVEIDVLESNLNIVPEGLGSFLYTSNLNPDMGLDKGLWAVLDLGYLTGDYLEFLDGVYVADSPDSNDRLGMKYVAGRVADYIHGIDGPKKSAAYIDSLLQKNDQVIDLSTEAYPIGDEYHAAMTELGKRIMDWMKRKTANKDVRGVLLTGGNVKRQVCFLNFPKLPKPLLCPDGELGNLLGAQLMLQVDI